MKYHKVIRNEVYEWVKDLSETFSNSRFVISSRPAAIREGWLVSEGFEEADLQPMELSDMKEFIDHWHNAVEVTTQYEEEKENLSELASSLKTVISQNKSIRNLATSPLLCAVICALHRERHQQLPNDRIRLYEACCQMLLERRSKEQRLIVEEKDYVVLSYDQKFAFLKDVAYWMMKNAWPMITIERLNECLSRKLETVVGLSKRITSNDILRLFLDRSGMIREPVLGKIDFSHRTFQEFAAAHAAIDKGDIGFLVNNALDDQWREVIILAAGLAKPKDREELIYSLISRGDEERKNRHQLHLLAVACLETSVELSQDLRRDLNKRLARLVPPTNVTEAKQLASAAELAIPFLKFRQVLTAKESAACVRTLSLIGGETALNVLETYRSERRQTALKELLRAASHFDIDVYTKRVLSGISNVNEMHLSLENLVSFQKYNVLKKLRKLRVWDSKSFASLEPLENLKELESLNLESFYVNDIMPLSHLHNLKELSFFNYWHSIKNICALKKLEKLESLLLSFFGDLTDIEPIGHLTSLKSLRLHHFNKVDDISPLKNLKKLNKLELNGLNINNITPLSHLENLEKLELSSVGEFTSLAPLRGLKNLKILTLTNIETGDLKELVSLEKLTALYLWHCPNIHDLYPLLELKNLKTAYLWGTGVRKIPEELNEKIEIHGL